MSKFITLFIPIIKFIIGIFFVIYVLGNGPFSVSLFNWSTSFYESIIFVWLIFLIFTGIELGKSLYQNNNSISNSDNIKILLLSAVEIFFFFLLYSELFVVIITFIPVFLLLMIWQGENQLLYNALVPIIYIFPATLAIFFTSLTIQNILSIKNRY